MSLLSARCLVALSLGVSGQAAHAQFDYTVYGVADFSYGRFEPSGFEALHRFNSNSLSPTFIGGNASYGLEGGWKPGITLESFIRFQDFKGGRSERDPFFSRKAFVSLANNNYGNLSLGRLQTLLFDTTVRFNALGNSIAFSPAIRHLYASGNLEGVQGDFYWDRAVGYVSPLLFDTVTVSAMHSFGDRDNDDSLTGASVVFSRGVFATSLSWQRVRIDNRVNDPTQELTWQVGGSYNFGWARLFATYTHTDDHGLETRSRLLSGGAAVPLGPGTLLLQSGQARAEGIAVDRKHTSLSGAYVYDWDSLTQFYAIAMLDRVRNQTSGRSYAVGVRYTF